jgi:hypothetical protein
MNPYDLHYSSKLYREEALREARERHLIGLARTDRKRLSGLSWVGLRWSRLLSLLRVPGISGLLVRHIEHAPAGIMYFEASALARASVSAHPVLPNDKLGHNFPI